MAVPQCPQCATILTSRESRSKKCPSCNASLTGRNAAPHVGPAGRAVEANRPTGLRSGICEVTGRQASDLTTRYLHVMQASAAAGSVTLRSINVEVQCSQRAFRRGRRIMWTSMALGLQFLLAFALAMVVGSAMSVLGVPESMIRTVALPMFLWIPISLLVGPIAMAVYRRRALNALIAEPLNARLKELNGCKDWGFRNGVVFLKQPPRGGSVIPLSDGRLSANEAA